MAKASIADIRRAILKALSKDGSAIGNQSRYLPRTAERAGDVCAADRRR